MQPTEAAWLAGYIDGDGCITLTKRSGRQFRDPWIVIDSCDLEMLEYVQSIAGGAIVPKAKSKEHHNQAFSWRLKGALKINSVLSQVYPYLRCPVKRDRAKMLIQEWHSITPRNGQYTEDLRRLKADFERRFLHLGEGRGSRTMLRAD